MEHHYPLAPLAQICLKGGGVGVLMSFWWVTHSPSPKMGIRSEKETHICPFFRMLKKLIGLAVALKKGICIYLAVPREHMQKSGNYQSTGFVAKTENESEKQMWEERRTTCKPAWMMWMLGACRHSVSQLRKRRAESQYTINSKRAEPKIRPAHLVACRPRKKKAGLGFPFAAYSTQSLFPQLIRRTVYTSFLPLPLFEWGRGELSWPSE